MKNEPRIVKEFPVCPWCGSNEICTELAIEALGLREKGMVKPTDTVSAQKIMLPLVDAQRVAVVTMPIMLEEKDTCGGCGRERTIRVSALEAPIGMIKGAG